ncbi:MAG: putative ABC transporter permease subunit [Oscillospiraceae bacterium]
MGSVAPLFVSFFVVMTYTTACSISLEGKNFWLLRSLPVSTRTVLWSKIALNLLLILPVVALNAVILSIGLRVNVLQAALLFFTPAAYGLFISIAGQLLNLLFPNFGWTNETAVIKQSAPAFLTMLAGFWELQLWVLLFSFGRTAFRRFLPSQRWRCLC